MIDTEKVLHGLSSCGNDYGTPNICELTECPYGKVEAFCVHNLARDAMMLISELLKAQEPVEPTEPDEDNTQYCGACGSAVGYEVLEPSGIGYIKYNYCPMCGRSVRWE